MFNQFNIFFSMFFVFFIIMFILTIGIFCVTFFRIIRQNRINRQSPALYVNAKVISKRAQTDFHHHHHSDMMNHTSSTTAYYVTFEFEGGDRMEFAVDGQEYGLLREEDEGVLHFQGTQYLGFERKRKTDRWGDSR